MSFQEKVKSHLVEYKEQVLNIFEPGLYKHDGKTIPYKHILPKEKASLNIIETYRDKFYQSEYSDIDYHKYFHHLNSSQALCINFFYPLLAESRGDLLLEVLGQSVNEIKESSFEYVSDIEKSNSRKTNFDLFLELINRHRVYVEVKYTEQEFGKAKHDESHLSKFKATYLPLLEKNVFINDKYKSPVQFFNYYQILRNLVHINESSTVVFFYPEENKKIHQQALKAKEELLTDSGRDRLQLITLEKAISHLDGGINSNALSEHYNEFRDKYLIKIT